MVIQFSKRVPMVLMPFLAFQASQHSNIPEVPIVVLIARMTIADSASSIAHVNHFMQKHFHYSFWTMFKYRYMQGDMVKLANAIIPVAGTEISLAP
ncbi:MAG TPA: hypothetical protein VFE62_10135 [Gemmataceae bacterium]|nr:hypothetical protein [Gemmataceae bacterium]